MTHVFRNVSAFYDKVLDFRLGILLFLCLLVGGNSGYSIGLKYVLYLFAIFAGASCLSVKMRDWRHLLNLPTILGLLLLGLYFLYMIPMPSIWLANLPFRDIVSNGYDLTGFVQPNLPLSLTPETTYISLYDFIPPLVIVVLVFLSPRTKEVEFAIRTVLFTILISGILALFQILLASPGLYLQSKSLGGSGIPAGFFANPNHFSTLLVIGILFAGSHLLRNMKMRRFEQVNSAIPIAVFILILLLLLTFAASTAAIIILGLTLIPMLLILANTFKFRLAILAIGILGFAVFIFDYLVLGQNLLSIETQIVGNDTTRLEIWKTVLQHSSFPSLFGTGPGSFYETYLIMSSSNDFTNIYINEAHNDYLQIVMELGLIGGALVAIYLIWFGQQFISALFHESKYRNEKLLLLFSLLVPILHSVTDYPLRTPAIMAIFVFFTTLLVRLNQLEKEGVA